MTKHEVVTPVACEAVAARGRMVLRDGERYRTYRPENWGWRDWLCDRDVNGRLVGKDPMGLPLDVLSASGHPQTRASAVSARLREMHGINHPDDELGWFIRRLPRRLTEVREEVCKPCSSENLAEIRRCAIYDCPAWAFRMGRNPHNPQRGKNPFAAAEIVPEGDGDACFT